MEKISVAVRVRPHISEESFNGTQWKVDDNRVSLHRAHGTPISGTSYTFDHVFEEGCSNARVYEFLIKDIIRAAVEGFNGTAFAYGQTSSGKTFTMNGSERDPGIIRRAVKDIFDRIHMLSDREYLVRVSYMEIYNEEINDLLTVENQKLQIHEHLERGVFVAGLREEIVNSPEQVLKLIESGEVKRHFGETNMNVRSSRSHTIFRMVVESKNKDADSSSGISGADAVRVSVLNLVDLAGSERIAKTGADGVRLKEGKHINKSLMALGNVINKLSDGEKHRGHIPYRDSKLTRILQPALGGNAKTSIICTIAPEEIHVEETKGTLQFASRAKRIANCVQVNEILSDAALLKRQKLEIEDLRGKLQGSHAEVLEQEILKLRNDLLKYELEHEKLEMKLEEERKSHKERERCIREQQLKIDNPSNPITFSDSERNSCQRQDSGSSIKEDGNENSCASHGGDGFSTPCFKAAPGAFVARRSNHSTLPDYSPLPDTISSVADEDTWMKMNKGFIADLDSLQITPARHQSFPTSVVTPGFSNEDYKQEIQNLKRQLQVAIEERDAFKRKHAEQISLNTQIVSEISDLQKEAQLIQKIPHKFSECIANCRNVYADVWSTMKNVSHDKSSTAKLLSSMDEICTCLFVVLETYFSMALDGSKSVGGNDNLIQQQKEALSARLHSAVKSLASSEGPTNEHATKPLFSSQHKGCILGGETAIFEGKLSSELNHIKERYKSLEKEMECNKQLLEVSKQRYDSLETEFHHLKEERDSLQKMVSESSQELALVTDQKENVLKNLNTELQRRKDVEEKIKQFAVAFSHKQTSMMNFHGEIKSKIEKMTGQKNPVLPTKDYSKLSAKQ